MKEISIFSGENTAEEFFVRKFSILMHFMDNFETEVEKQLPKIYKDKAFFKRMKHFWEIEAPKIAEADILERKKSLEKWKLRQGTLIKNFNDKYSGSFLETGKDER